MAGWPVPPDRIDFLFLTHAHIDHIGRLPGLIKRSPRFTAGSSLSGIRRVKSFGPGAYVYLDDRRCDIRARVHQLSGYSAHADQADLINWVAAMERPPGKIKLVHGEPAAQAVLAEKLRAEVSCEVA